MPLFKPDSFEGDPYGHFTNQASHALAVGLCGLLLGLAWFWWWLLGEFPPKAIILAAALILYLAYELIDQGWHGWDTVADTFSVVGIGVGGGLWVFDELEPGSLLLVADLQRATIVAFVMFIWIGAGSARRWWQAR